MKKSAMFALLIAGFLGGTVFVYSCGGGGGGGGGSAASAAAMNVGTPISSLPFTITQPGLYYLTGNLSPPVGVADGIIVSVDDVTIDLMGYTLDGNNSTSAGIFMSGRGNVEVRNGTVRAFTIGINEAGSGSAHRIVNMRVLSNLDTGISLNGLHHLVKDCTITTNGSNGIAVSQGATISGNIVSDNTVNGLSAGAGSTIIGNTTSNNTLNGIVAGAGSTVSGNTAFSNGDDGIRIPLQGATVRGNTTYSNGGNGIDIQSGNSMVDGNTAFNNTAANLVCVSCTGANHAP